MDTSGSRKIKVLYISGAARSGSTLLGLLLQQMPGFCHAGELYHIWTRGFLHDEFCSCELRFSCCPFWSQVKQEAFGSHVNIQAAQIKKEVRFLQRMRRVPQIVFPRMQNHTYEGRWNQHSQRLIQLYKAIHAVSGCHTIVDSSKSPLYALILSRIPLIEVHIVHLIRDSRAVAFSWQRRKPRHQRVGDNMPTYTPLHSACTWNLANSLTQALRFVAVSHQRIRYEDLVANVPLTLKKILQPLCDVTTDQYPFGQITANTRGHAMSGNPVRFERGPIDILLDNEWKRVMAKREKWIATAVTFPLLLYYGYRV